MRLYPLYEPETLLPFDQNAQDDAASLGASAAVEGWARADAPERAVQIEIARGFFPQSIAQIRRIAWHAAAYGPPNGNALRILVEIRDKIWKEPPR